MSGLLFWWHSPQTCSWEFRTEDRSRVIAVIADEFVWVARKEPARTGLQNYLLEHGIDQLPDRAFDFQEVE